MQRYDGVLGRRQSFARPGCPYMREKERERESEAVRASGLHLYIYIDY
jgi:hypothetical protein